ncbi:MAG: metallophosphoesterase [Planctomycetes bacterium]|nr:metallophosphoesterase [Planctomycetota bacterium]
MLVANGFPTLRILAAFVLAVLVSERVPRAVALDSAPSATATGVVFVDANNNERFDEGERPLPGVRVSNGRDVVSTGADGRYRIPVDDDDILFVIKPRDHRTPLSNERLPRFHYIHKPNGSPPQRFAGVAPTGPLPASIDFPLYPSREPDAFRMVLFGDPQPRDQKEVHFIAQDVVHELIGIDAAFGVTLGDIVFDDLTVFDALTKTVALIGIPWYNVIGNHDTNQDAVDDRTSDETFERIFGPSYYSFDHGPVHFLVLDDIEWHVPGDGKKATYRGGLGGDQMTFIRNDLAGIPNDQLVVLMMHIPLVNVGDRQELYRLIEQRPFCISISGHTHTHEHHFIADDDGWKGKKPHHHIVNVTVSGSWWGGAPDDRGIPHTTMSDGGPNGYTILSFDGTRYELDYRAAGRGADYQIRIHAPSDLSVSESSATNVYANVFNGSVRSKVEMRVDDGAWLAMEKTAEADPHYQKLFDDEAALLATKVPTWRSAAKPGISTHLWKQTLPSDLAPGIHTIRVRTVDMHDRTFEAKRVVRIVEPSTAAQASP